jgi:hypothetical protein
LRSFARFKLINISHSVFESNHLDVQSGIFIEGVTGAITIRNAECESLKSYGIQCNSNDTSTVIIGHTIISDNEIRSHVDQPIVYGAIALLSTLLASSSVPDTALARGFGTIIAHENHFIGNRCVGGSEFYPPFYHCVI